MFKRIICPYCFAEFNHNEVHFRSEHVSDPNKSPLDAKYEDDIDKYRETSGDSPEVIEKTVREYRIWQFFGETNDKEYESFWKQHGESHNKGAMDTNSARIIDPQNPEHRQFLMIQSNGEYYSVDSDGMADGVVLFNNTQCNQRVCKFCHNPLPKTYGKAKPRFVSVIGTRGSGKTVFLSRLLSNIEDFASRVGLTVTPTANAEEFLANHEISEREPLPIPTPPQSFQAPVIFDVQISTGNRTRKTETLVLYDVAGEFFVNRELWNDDDIDTFCKCIKYSDGMIFLIEPKQFIGGPYGPTQALVMLNNVISQNANTKTDKPLAVCISQCDDKYFREVFGIDLYERLMSAHDHAPYYRYLDEHIREYFMNLYEIQHRIRNVIQSKCNYLNTRLGNNYSNYAYFAFSSLSNGVIERAPGTVDTSEYARFEQRHRTPGHLRNKNILYDVDIDIDVDESYASVKTHEYQDSILRENNEDTVLSIYPKGPIISKHIEDPLLWLLHCFGYYRSPIPMYSVVRDVRCDKPECGSYYTYPLGKVETIQTVAKAERNNRFGFRETTRKITVNYCCAKCGRKFYAR